MHTYFLEIYTLTTRPKDYVFVDYWYKNILIFNLFQSVLGNMRNDFVI